MKKIIIVGGLAVIFFLTGVLCGYKLITPEQVIKKVEVTKTVDKIIYRDYSKINSDEAFAKLVKYDTTPFNSTIEAKELKQEYTLCVMRWDLYERNGEQEFKVPVYQSGNFKFYVGIGIGFIAAGGLCYAGYKIFK